MLRLSCGGVVFTLSALDEFSDWLAIVSKLRKGVLGSRARSELKECGLMRSRLMGERSGRANSVLSRMCGRGGVAGDVTVTSRRGWKGSAGRRSLQSRETGPQALRRRAGRKTEKFGVWKQRERNSERGLMLWKRKEEGRMSLLEKEGIRKMCGESSWMSNMRPRAAENWVNRRKSCKRSYEMSTGYQGVTAAPVARCGEMEA